jgi:hypothetical protein
MTNKRKLGCAPSVQHGEELHTCFTLDMSLYPFI